MEGRFGIGRLNRHGHLGQDGPFVDGFGGHVHGAARDLDPGSQGVGHGVPALEGRQQRGMGVEDATRDRRRRCRRQGWYRSRPWRSPRSGAVEGVHDPVGVGGPVEAGPEALALDELDGHAGRLSQAGGRRRTGRQRPRRPAGRRRGWRPGWSRRPTPGPRAGAAGRSHEDASRPPTGPTLWSWPGSPTCWLPGGRTRSSSSPRRATPSTPAWSRRCWTSSRCGRPLCR